MTTETPPNDPNKTLVAFQPLEKINTHAATPATISYDNIRKAIKLPYYRFHEMNGFKVPKGDMKIALIGGGPSIEKQIDAIKNFDGVTVACGSSYDWCVNNGITPNYCVVCDPDPISANYITKPQFSTIFLVATQCDPKVFDTLKLNAIFMWHCYNEDFEGLKDIEPEFQAVGGGCTVGLRSLSLAIMMGYKDIHFFGFDSCLGENDKHHAYDFTTDTEELGSIYLIKLDPTGNKTYTVAGYQLAQAQHFKDFYEHYNEVFTPTFHGEGLLPDLYRFIRKEAERLEAEMMNKGTTDVTSPN